MTGSMAVQGIYARLTCGADRERDSLAKEFLLHGTATIWYPHFLFAVSNLMRSNDQVLELSCSYHDAQPVLYGLFWQL